MVLDQLLPAAALPRFDAFQVRSPAFAWCNPDGGDSVSFGEHAYFVPLRDDPSDARLDAVRTFAAERYGGHGIGPNGGGARCGLAGALQIKGIGPNPLVGESTDFFHTYGGASLNEGIAEAVWGEIFHHVLPYGSARVRALITTGTRVPLVLPEPGQDPTTARALIVRDAVLRPAHFMRTPDFVPASRSDLPQSDVHRTRAAIARLGVAMSALLQPQAAQVDDADFLNDALARMLCRFGRQVAAARVKRLMHCSLIASNISIDGRWVDFGTATALPTWGRIVSPRGSELLEEELMLHPAMVELLFYLRKYLPKSVSSRLKTSAQLWPELTNALDAELPLQALQLLGLPQEAIKAVEPSLATAFWKAWERVIRAGNQRRFNILSDNSAESFIPYGRTGFHDLREILRALAVASDAGDADRRLQPLIPVPALREELVRSAAAAKTSYFESSGGRRAGAAQFCRFNALRLTSPQLRFYRPRFYREIGERLTQGHEANAIVEDMLQDARLHVFNDEDGVIDTSKLFGPSSQAHIDLGVSVHGGTLPWNSATEALQSALAQQDASTPLPAYEA